MHVLPNLVLDLLLSAASIGNSIVVVSGVPFYVVSPSSGSEEFYLKLSHLGAFNETSHTREDVLCAAILKSRPFFATEKNVEMVDPNDVRAYAEFHPERKGWSMFTRPYKVVNVSVHEYATPHQEAVFPCLAEMQGTNERRMYLISRVYDFDRWTEKRSINSPLVTGQFVFEYASTAKNMAKLIAVAEEPAQIFQYKPSEWVSFDNLKGDLDAIGNGGRSICEFPTGWKIRICSVVLNAEKYRSPYMTFLPFKNSIQPECEMKELIFKNDERYSFQFMEWVIGCKTTDPHYTYLVSLGYEPYQFLIFWPKGEHVFTLIHHFHSYLGANNNEYFQDHL